MPGVVREKNARHQLRSLQPTHYACAANGLGRSGQKPLALWVRALIGGSGRGPSSSRRPRLPATPRLATPPRSAARAASAAGCCPRGPPRSGRVVGAAPCRLGVPEACGFLWEEAARRRSAELEASEAQDGEIPLPPWGSLILPFPQGPGTRDLLRVPEVPKSDAHSTPGAGFRVLASCFPPCSLTFASP